MGLDDTPRRAGLQPAWWVLTTHFDVQASSQPGGSFGLHLKTLDTIRTTKVIDENLHLKDSWSIKIRILKSFIFLLYYGGQCVDSLSGDEDRIKTWISPICWIEMWALTLYPLAIRSTNFWGGVLGIEPDLNIHIVVSNQKPSNRQTRRSYSVGKD